MIFVVATLKTKPENLEALIDASRPCIKETLKEHGCLAYDLHQSIGDPDTLVFVERWQDRQALETHFGTAHIAVFRSAAGPLLENITIEIISPETIETL